METHYNKMIYSENLGKILRDNKFNCENIDELFDKLCMLTKPYDICLYTNYVCISNLQDEINKLTTKDENGCIFSLPGKRRDGKTYLYHTSLDESVILRALSLKYFL